MAFADVEAVLVTFLSSVPGVADVSVEMSNQPSLPFVRVSRVTGGDDYITDRPVIYVETFAADRQTSSDIARRIDQKMHHLRHTVVGGVLIDHCETINGPFWSNYQDENMERHIASYTVHSRFNASPI